MSVDDAAARHDGGVPEPDRPSDDPYREIEDKLRGNYERRRPFVKPDDPLLLALSDAYALFTATSERTYLASANFDDTTYYAQVKKLLREIPERPMPNAASPDGALRAYTVEDYVLFHTHLQIQRRVESEPGYQEAYEWISDRFDRIIDKEIEDGVTVDEIEAGRDLRRQAFATCGTKLGLIRSAALERLERSNTMDRFTLPDLTEPGAIDTLYGLITQQLRGVIYADDPIFIAFQDILELIRVRDQREMSSSRGILRMNQSHSAYANSELAVRNHQDIVRGYLGYYSVFEQICKTLYIIDRQAIITRLEQIHTSLSSKIRDDDSGAEAE